MKASPVKCPVCGNAVDHTLFSQDNFPFFTGPVRKDEKAHLLATMANTRLTAPLTVRACSTCCHCFVHPIPDQSIADELYGKYYHYPSPLERGFHPERDMEFLSVFFELWPTWKKRSHETRVLEIGCFDGFILYHLKQKGFLVTGCDPSRGADIGQKHDVPIVKDYFESQKFKQQGLRYDIIISRHFIEHLAHPKTWVNDLHSILSPDGLIVLETPNVAFYIARGLVEVFSLQHLQGYTKTSLARLLDNNGFGVHRLIDTPQNLISVSGLNSTAMQETVTTPSVWPTDLQEFQNRLAGNIETLSRLIRPYLEGDKKIALWGAGGFTTTALTLYGIPLSHIQYIIDSDSHKWDTVYLNHCTPIVSPQFAVKQPPDLIIITSMYSELIFKTIRENNIASDIITIFPEVQKRSI